MLQSLSDHGVPSIRQTIQTIKKQRKAIREVSVCCVLGACTPAETWTATRHSRTRGKTKNNKDNTRSGTLRYLCFCLVFLLFCVFSGFSSEKTTRRTIQLASARRPVNEGQLGTAPPLCGTLVCHSLVLFWRVLPTTIDTHMFFVLRR